MKYLIGFILGVATTLMVMTVMSRSKKNNNTNVAAPVAKEASSEDSNLTKEISADFDRFYEQFHADSLFQIGHIAFPLAGLPNNADSLTRAKGNYEWDAADWRMHKSLKGLEAQFNRTVKATGKDLVTEYIQQVGSSFVMERRFSKVGNEWYLIYYAGMNDLGT